MPARFMALLGCLLLSSLVSSYPEGVARADGDDYSDYYAWYRGKQAYEKNCLFCHGARGKGDGYALVAPLPADLTSPAVQNKPDDQLLKTIHSGRPGTDMGTWNWALSEQDKREVLAYIRWLAR